MARRVCLTSGCGRIGEWTRGRCPDCARDHDRARGTRQQRGYDAEHDRERARWQRVLDQGSPVSCRNPHCLTPDTPVDPKHWHLGHTPRRDTWRGPEHPDCNLTEAGSHSPTAPPP